MLGVVRACPVARASFLVSTSGAATTRPSETASRTARPPAAGQGMFVSDRECAPGPIARLQVIFSKVPRWSSGGHSVRRSAHVL